MRMRLHAKWLTLHRRMLLQYSSDMLTSLVKGNSQHRKVVFGRFCGSSVKQLLYSARTLFSSLLQFSNSIIFCPMSRAVTFTLTKVCLLVHLLLNLVSWHIIVPCIPLVQWQCWSKTNETQCHNASFSHLRHTWHLLVSTWPLNCAW